MSATGLDVFDKTLHTTNTWLKEIMTETGESRHAAWNALGAVLRTIRDRIPLELTAHLGAELPILVRGTYYDHWRPEAVPETYRAADEFVARIADNMGPTLPMEPLAAAGAVLRVLSRHLPEGQIRKVQDALPEQVRESWLAAAAIEMVNPESSTDTAASGSA
jgi:uncharacterized protein (DUF2267 family)